MSDTSEEVRFSAASSLGGVLGDDDEVVDSLAEVLSKKDEEPRVRGMAAESLGNIGLDAAVPALVAALRDPDGETRYWAVYALGEVGSPGALSDLERMAHGDSVAKVRKEALAAMRKIGEK